MRMNSHGPLFGSVKAYCRASAMLAAAIVIALPQAAFCQATNVVYVQTNDPTPGQNAIDAFSRNTTTGCLTKIGRFPTGGTGVYNFDDRIGPDDHAQEVMISPDRKYLLTVNGGSDTIAVFRINADGSLTAVKGSPFSSNGIHPVSIGITSDNKVYVVNQNGDPNRPNNAAPNYTGFRLVPGNGRLNPIPFSTVNLPAHSSPAQALVSGDGFLFGDLFLTTPWAGLPGADFLPPFGSLLDAFHVDANGRLTEVSGSPLRPFLNSQVTADINSRYLLGMWLHPTLPILYATSVVTNRLAVYTYNSEGQLNFVTDIAVGGADAITVCWVIVSPDGKFIYTSNAGSNSISAFDISGTVIPSSSPLSPQLIGVTSMVVPTGGAAPIPGVFNFPTVSFQIGNDPAGQYLFAIGHELVLNNSYPQGNVLHTLKVQSNGTVVESCPVVPIQNIPAGAHPQGVAVL
jgi:hypothetical protein